MTDALITQLQNEWNRLACSDNSYPNIDLLKKAADRIAALTAERDEYKRNLQAELDGNMEWRKLIGARLDETMFQTADRIAKERAALVKAEAERDIWEERAARMQRERDAETERCAKVCDANVGIGWQHVDWALEHCAAAIRAKDKT